MASETANTHDHGQPHVHGPDCGHDHGHSPAPAAAGHAHDHAHVHTDGGDYYLQQLVTIFVCGAFGVVGLGMKLTNRLDYMLEPTFHGWVVAGSCVLLALAAIRGVALWRAAGVRKAAPAHVHGPDCGHDHSHDHAAPSAAGHVHGPDCGHDHDDHSADDHAHGNVYWRVIILALPIALFMIGLPNGSFSADWTAKRLGADAAIDTGEATAATDKIASFDFAGVASLAYLPEKRDVFGGAAVVIDEAGCKLKKVDGREKEFTLYKLKMTCCAADVVPLKARIVCDDAEALAQARANTESEVVVRGVLQFVRSGTGEYVTVIRVKSGQGEIRKR